MATHYAGAEAPGQASVAVETFRVLEAYKAQENSSLDCGTLLADSP